MPSVGMMKCDETCDSDTRHLSEDGAALVTSAVRRSARPAEPTASPSSVPSVLQVRRAQGERMAVNRADVVGEAGPALVAGPRIQGGPHLVLPLILGAIGVSFLRKASMHREQAEEIEYRIRKTRGPDVAGGKP